MASIQVQKGRKSPFRVFWIDQNTGKQRNRSFGRRKDALVFMESIRALENTLTQNDPNMTIEQAMHAWYIKATTTGLGGREPVERSTACKYNEHKNIITSREGQTKLCKLDELECENIRDRLLEDYSRAYAKKIFTSFKSALTFAANQKKIVNNPAQDVNIQISKRQRNANKTQIPSLEDVYGITQAIERLMRSPDPNIRPAWVRYGPLFYTLLYTGMRPTEIRGLPWRDVRWERGGIQITQGADQFNEIGALKTGAAERFIPTPSFVMQHLKRWQEFCPQGEHNLVFPTWIGTVESHQNITSRGWYPLCKEAGLVTPRGEKLVANYSLYSLRHIKASLEIELGRSPKKIQEIMGHEDIKMTFDVYGHLFKDLEMQDNADEAHELVRSVAKRLPKKNQVIDIYSKISTD